MAVKGIDVSKHNGVIDFNKVKAAGVDFVIIRAGIGISQPKDEMFELNYNNAKAAGLHVGCYWFLRSLTPAAAAKEAQTFLDIIRGKKFEYPVYLDFEEDPDYNYFPFRTGKNNCTAMVKAFCDAVENAGYFTGVYMNRGALENNVSTELINSYSVWVAQWAKECTYRGSYGMWQYSDKGRIDGISGNVDLDYAYTDFPKVIKAAGRNGFRAESTSAESKTYCIVLDGDKGEAQEALKLLKLGGYEAKIAVIKRR